MTFSMGLSNGFSIEVFNTPVPRKGVLETLWVKLLESLLERCLSGVPCLEEKGWS